MTLLAAHLRANLVAYLALVIALGGTSYAAVQLPRNSVGAPQIKKNAVAQVELRRNAVTSAKVKNRSLRTGDLAVGVLPPDAWIDVDVLGNNPPPRTDARLPRVQRTVTTPRAGDLLVQLQVRSLRATCTAGPARVGLYLDEQPVDGTAQGGLEPARPIMVTAVVPSVAAGPHELALHVYCSQGATENTSGLLTETPWSWVVRLLP